MSMIHWEKSLSETNQQGCSPFVPSQPQTLNGWTAIGSRLAFRYLAATWPHGLLCARRTVPQAARGLFFFLIVALVFCSVCGVAGTDCGRFLRSLSHSCAAAAMAIRPKEREPAMNARQLLQKARIRLFSAVM